MHLLKVLHLSQVASKCPLCTLRSGRIVRSAPSTKTRKTRTGKNRPIQVRNWHYYACYFYILTGLQYLRNLSIQNSLISSSLCKIASNCVTSTCSNPGKDSEIIPKITVVHSPVSMTNMPTFAVYGLILILRQTLLLRMKGVGEFTPNPRLHTGTGQTRNRL